MLKRWLVLLSLMASTIGLAIAAHQWFGWNYWNPEQQFSLFHHEGLALLFVGLGMGAGIVSLLIRKKREY